MDFNELVKNRRSIKKFEEDYKVDDAVIQEAIELAAYTPNHGMREPWRVIWVKKERLADYGRLFAEVNFKNDVIKMQNYIEMVRRLGGILIIAGPVDRRQKQRFEDVLAVGGYMQTLSLALFSSGVGSCIKTPATIFEPAFNDGLNIHAGEMVYGMVYLTALPAETEVKVRQNTDLISEF